MPVCSEKSRERGFLPTCRKGIVIVPSDEIKCVVWDLDNTVWDGILLEGDPLCLRPGIEAIITTLDRRGILHSIASKGIYADAIHRLREFGLEAYFLYPQITWNPKSESIARIQTQLNIGPNAIMFIDDQRFEREEVKSAHPEVVCMDAADYRKLLDDPRLNPARVTQESSRRRQMYLIDRQRRCDQENFKGPRKDFLESLAIRFSIAEARDADLAIVQDFPPYVEVRIG